MKCRFCTKIRTQFRLLRIQIDEPPPLKRGLHPAPHPLEQDSAQWSRSYCCGQTTVKSFILKIAVDKQWASGRPASAILPMGANGHCEIEQRSNAMNQIHSKFRAEYVSGFGLRQNKFTRPAKSVQRNKRKIASLGFSADADLFRSSPVSGWPPADAAR
jgi:hypothetical protein